MSQSKEEPPPVPEEELTPGRLVRCTRCLHHGIVVAKRGHGKRCPFLLCRCWKCNQVTQRTETSDLHRRLKKKKPSQERLKPGGQTGETGAEGGPPPRPTISAEAWAGRAPAGFPGRADPGGEPVSGLDIRDVLPPAPAPAPAPAQPNSNFLSRCGPSMPPTIPVPWVMK